MFIRKDVFFRVSKNTSSLTFFNNVLLIMVILTVILYIYVSSCSSVNITFLCFLFQFFVLNDSVLVSLVELSLEVRFHFTRVLKITGCSSVRNVHGHVKAS